MFFQATTPLSGLARDISDIESFVGILVYALIAVCGIGAGVVVYLLRREDKYRSEIHNMVSILVREDQSRKEIRALVLQLTGYMNTLERLTESLNKAVTALGNWADRKDRE